MRESVDLRQKRPGTRGFLVRQFTGWDIRKSVGDFVSKIRRIDRLRGRYIEHVETEDGAILRHTDEPLSEHQGHGSAKRR